MDNEKATTQDEAIEAGDFHPCDFNQDGAVDFQDMEIFMASFGKKPGDEGYNERCNLDGDSDGVVNGSDWEIFRKAWNRP